MGSTWGNTIKISIFGESHGTGIGVVIDGFPWGMPPNFMPEGPAPTFASMPTSSPALAVPPPQGIENSQRKGSFRQVYRRTLLGS